MTEPDREIDVAEVAKLLGVSESAVYKNKRLKRNPMNTDGITFFLSDIRAYQQSSKTQRDELKSKYEVLASQFRQLNHKITLLENDNNYLKAQIKMMWEVLEPIGELPNRFTALSSSVKEIKTCPKIKEMLDTSFNPENVYK